MKYALIGCGMISPNHIKAALESNLEIVLLFGRSEGRRCRKAEGAEQQAFQESRWQPHGCLPDRRKAIHDASAHHRLRACGMVICQGAQ